MEKMHSNELNDLVEKLAEQGVFVKIEDAKKDLYDIVAGKCNGNCSQGKCSGGSGYRPEEDLFADDYLSKAA